MSTAKINDGRTLRSFLENVFSEGVKSALAQKALTEKEKQNKLSSGSDDDNDASMDDLFGGDDSSDDQNADASTGDSGDEPSGSSKTMDDETEKLKRGDIKAKDVVEKLNSIRSGKSFKDDQIAKSMNEYIDSLSRPEKVALFAFLKGIAQIVTGEIPSQQAEEPSNPEPDVQMQKGTKKDVKHVRPNVIKGAGGDGNKHSGNQNSGKNGEQEKSVSHEDTSAPAPIVPKKR